MCESSCWSGLREQIIDNLLATGTFTDRGDIVIATIRNDAGYQALVTVVDGFNPSYPDVKYVSTYCDDTTKALKSLLRVVEGEAWKAREGTLTEQDMLDLDGRRSQLSCIYPRPSF
ncbi:hypothetical protein BDZ91DRAFT_736532 [Kalaharituber pfeilii]|nr:hypothetical protein BDZ91DRAFT_736532 [Kalaharituber pfeilii]